MSLVLGKNPSNELKEIELTNTGNLKVDLAGSSGGAISANVDITGNTIGLATDTTLNSRASEATVLTLATETTASAMNVNLNTIAGAVSGTEFQVDVVSSALPTGASSEATLSSIDGYQSAIANDIFSLDTKTTQGYDAQIASGGNGLVQNLVYGRDASGNLDALLVNASGELKVASSASGATTTNVAETLATGAGGTATSTAVDMDGSTNLTIFGQTDNNADAIEVLVSHDNSTYYTDPSSFVATQPSGSNTDFSIQISSSGARYFKIRQVDTLTTAFTVVVNSSKK